MNTTGKEIVELLNASGAAAPDITKPLKSIGGGNMLDGVRKIFNYALAEGEKTGFVTGEERGFAKGSMITLAAGGALYLIPKGVKYVKAKAAESKAHDALGEKIHAAFSEEVADRPGEEASTDEVAENGDGAKEAP